jgi:ribosome-binding factor A
MTRRIEKVNDLVQSELADLLRRRVKDPVLQDAFLSITHVAVAPDLTTARVHVSLMNPDEEGEAVLAALERTAPFLHRELVKRIRIKRVPRLRFLLDRSIAEADRLTTIIRDVAREERNES